MFLLFKTVLNSSETMLKHTEILKKVKFSEKNAKI